MRSRSIGIVVVFVILWSFTFMCNTAWALKNVCPECKVVIENLELTACPLCGKVINKCLQCGKINPIKNDNCSSCNATLAESRVLQTIDKETRQNLRLGESTRSQIEVELRQIEEEVSIGELTPDLAAKQVELLTQIGWWSKANTLANEFTTKFPGSDKTSLVAACQVTALRNLGFLALNEKNYAAAKKYLKTALSIDPKDKKSKNLLTKIAGHK